MALKIDSLEVEVKTQADSASASIGRLNKELSKMVRKADKMDKLANAMEKVKKSVDGGGGGSKASRAGGVFMQLLGKKGGGFLKSIGRIALYRGIRTAMKAITTAVKEGTNNLYQYGKAMNSAFVQSLDSAATSVQYLKNGLAVGLAPIIQALTPIVTSLADTLADVGNAISEIYAASQNNTTFTKAVKSFKEYAQAVDQAKNATLGFDELNVINNDKSFAGMFEEVAVDTERAAENMSRLRSIVSSIIGIGIGAGVAKGLGTLTSAGVLEMPIGKIALAASSVTLLVSGAIDVYGAIKDALESGTLTHGGKLELAKGLTEVGGGLSLILKNPIPLVVTSIISLVVSGDAIGQEIDNAVKDIQSSQSTRSLTIPIELGLGMTSGGAIMLSDIINFDFGNLLIDWGTFVTNICIDIVNIFKFLWNAIIGAFDVIMNGPIQVFNGIMEALNNVFGTNYALIEEFDFSGWYEEFNDHISFEQGRIGGNWFYQPEPIGGQQTGDNLMGDGTMNGIEGELVGKRTDRNGRLHNRENINLYIDGKQIYGAIRDAERTIGVQVAKGLAME